MEWPTLEQLYDSIGLGLIPALVVLIKYGSQIIGVGLLFISIKTVAENGAGKRTGGLQLAMLYGLVGTVLIQIDPSTAMFSETLFEKSDLFLYSVNRNNPYDYLNSMAVGLLFVVGLVGFIRGWLMFRLFGQTHGVFAKGIVHIIGGTIAMNIVDFNYYVLDTFGIRIL